MGWTFVLIVALVIGILLGGALVLVRIAATFINVMDRK